MLPATPTSVTKSLEILARHQALFGGKERCVAEADIARVVQVFERIGARWVLVGAHAVGLMTEPRATADFDFIVEDQKLRPLLAALEEVFGDLDVSDIGAALRLRAIDVDLIRSTNHPLFQRALDDPWRVADWNVARVEALLVLKFLSAVSPWRASDRRGQDIVDLRSVYRAVGRKALDEALMIELASLVYPGAEREFADLLARIDRGELIQI
jgi:hypothetical protein